LKAHCAVAAGGVAVAKAFSPHPQAYRRV